MPKIRAASVEAHREAQLQAVLEASRDLIQEEGLGALTFGEVASRTGLGRTTIYEYFKTKGDLLEALVMDEVPAWREHLGQALEGMSDPAEAVGAFVETQLKLVASGKHDLLFIVSEARPAPISEAQVNSIHHELAMLLAPHLKQLGIRDVPTALHLMFGIVRSAAELVRAKPRDKTVRALAKRMAIAGLAGLTEKP